jgi:hypothetical protein
MIRVDINETFPITVSLVDEVAQSAATGKTVYYDIRQQPGDVSLAPPVAGILVESTIEPGIYNALETIDTAGEYVVYATCSGFISNTEEIIVNDESIYDVVKNTHQYNISVEDVIRETVTPTASQAARNVPVGLTDYVITWIKAETDADWASPVSSGVVWAHYRDLASVVPYKMGGPF